MKIHRKPETFMMRLGPHGLIPADSYTQERMAARGYRLGDLIACQFKKPNNVRFHRLVHRIGQLCAANIDAFNGMDAHTVLKRLQWEANVACEEIGVKVPGVGLAVMRFPLSWAFDSMDDGARHEAARGLCRYISVHYWPGMSAQAIEEMADAMVAE